VGLAPAKEKDELLAVVALELDRAGQDKIAGTIAAPLLKPYEEKPAKAGAAAGSPPPIGPNRLALAVALDQVKAAGKNVPAAPGATGKPVEPEARLGYALGYACQGKWDQARQAAEAPGAADQRVEALTAVADFAVGKNDDAARQAVQQAVSVLQKELKGKDLSPWLVCRLVRTGARVGLVDQVRPAADAIAAADLRARAQREVYGAILAAQGKADLEEMDQAAQKPASPILLEGLARYNARYASSAALFKTIDRWDPKQQACGFIGVALGEQDSDSSPKTE
jgi:hypothetical protein